MTDRHREPVDDALRERLRATDPARSLPPAAPGRVTRLLEETMDTQPTQPTQHSPGPGVREDPTAEEAPARETGARGRSPLTWLVAAAAVLLIAGAAVFGVLGHEQASAPSAGGGGGGGGGSTPTTTRLDAPARAAYQARCMVPTAAALAHQGVAFDGTVRSIAAGVVTLVPSHFYAGDSTDLVEVRAPGADLPALVSAVHFQEGRRYLVSATGGTVSLCGFSAPWSPGLAALYTRAFEG